MKTNNVQWTQLREIKGFSVKISHPFLPNFASNTHSHIWTECRRRTSRISTERTNERKKLVEKNQILTNKAKFLTKFR